MIEKDHLKYFITEEIILVDEERNVPGDHKETEKITTSPEKTHDVLVWTHELTQKDQELLAKMLKAVKLDMEKVYLIHHEEDYTTHFKNLLSFGHVDFITEKVNKEIFLNKPFQHESKNILVSYSISSLHEDVKRKTELWEGLKKMFRL